MSGHLWVLSPLAKGPSSISTIKGYCVWLFTPKFNVPAFQVPASPLLLAGLMSTVLLTNNPQKLLKASCAPN